MNNFVLFLFIFIIYFGAFYFERRSCALTEGNDRCMHVGWRHAHEGGSISSAIGDSSSFLQCHLRRGMFSWAPCTW